MTFASSLSSLSQERYENEIIMYIEFITYSIFNLLVPILMYCLVFKLKKTYTDENFLYPQLFIGFTILAEIMRIGIAIIFLTKPSFLDIGLKNIITIAPKMSWNIFLCMGFLCLLPKLKKQTEKKVN